MEGVAAKGAGGVGAKIGKNVRGVAIDSLDNAEKFIYLWR